jgi:hypothetical protein
MTFLKELAEEMVQYIGDRRILNLIVGIKLISVMLDNGEMGVSNSFYSKDYNDPPYVGNIKGRKVEEVLNELINDDYLLSRSILMAILSSTDRTLPVNEYKGNILDIFNKDEKICVIGFGISSLNVSNEYRLEIYDLSKMDISSLNASSLECSNLIIYSSSIILRIGEDIINMGKTKKVILTGLGVPKAIITFRRKRISLASKSYFSDTERVMRIVSEGGGPQSIAKYMRRYYYIP